MADIRKGAGDTTMNKLDNVLNLKAYSLVQQSITLGDASNAP